MDDSSNKIPRREVLKQLVVLPALAAAFAGVIPVAAEAADNKKQFHYQNKPGSGGRKCSGCRFFKAPHACSIVNGTISPNGWCIAWAKK